MSEFITNGRSSTHSPPSEILLHIAEHTGEIRSDVKHVRRAVVQLEQRVSNLEKQPLTVKDWLPWAYGVLVLVLAWTGKLKLTDALALLAKP